MAGIGAADIEKMIARALESPTQSVKKLHVITAINNMNTLAKDIEQVNLQLLQLESTIENYKAQGLAENSAIHFAYSEMEYGQQKEQLESDLLTKSLEGYETVNKVRLLLTKEKINYQLGIGSKTSAKLLQMQITYLELAPMVYLTKAGHGGGFSLRIRLSQSSLKNLDSKDQTAINRIESFVPGASTLYSAVYRYFTDTTLLQKGNWGNFYLVYRFLLAKNSKGNLYRPATKTIAKAFRSVLSGGGKGGSFSAGGDVGLSQVKASFGSDPTLTSVNTIVNQLNDLTSNLLSFLNTGNQEGLIKMLTREKVGVKVLDSARLEAIANIKLALAGFLTT